ncbi:hypothetical protein BZK31_07695 [Pseudomonas floridensis]|uniref:Uncharacterized protein n=1 Tax=Pseudomonas floridensis TaxID=1958950 RepID=A0A1X0N8V6_9PSED|nr:hypothetical protein BZK31_07695 [Pseudomonas floridensis]
MQIKRKSLIILRAVALLAALMYFLIPGAGYNTLFLSVVWLCIGVNLSTMLPIWEKSPEQGPNSRFKG